MKYDPNNPLTEEQATALSEDDFFEYLDSKSKYDAEHMALPLSTRTMKMFAHRDAIARGVELTQEEHRKISRFAAEHGSKDWQ